MSLYGCRRLLERYPEVIGESGGVPVSPGTMGLLTDDSGRGTHVSWNTVYSNWSYWRGVLITWNSVFTNWTTSRAVNVSWDAVLAAVSGEAVDSPS